MSEALNDNQAISVLKVRDVLLVTMHADPTDSTVAMLQDRVLAAMERYAARGLILDISAVDTLDSYFARSVSETTQMIALMGGLTVIAGMHPSVAITATQLGLNLGQAMSTLSVDRALDYLEAA